MSGEVMADVGESSRIAQNYLEFKINEIIENYSLGIYEKWAVIAIILDNRGSNYPEVFKNHKSKKMIEFRLKIDHDEFLNASEQNKIVLIAKMLLRSLDKMETQNHNLKIPQNNIDALRKVINRFI
jgi:hypothetical protein